MNIHFTDEALQWFQKEMDLQKGDSIRFYVRYGGSSPIQEGFSLGLNKEAPMETGAEKEQEGILFFVEERDLWYFDGYDLHVGYDEKRDEPVYDYHKK
ncbi:MAG TPA: HesB/YadR/YfhF family protein [Bacillaceae bacterium]